jgi:hypothetical protein
MSGLARNGHALKHRRQLRGAKPKLRPHHSITSSAVAIAGNRRATSFDHLISTPMGMPAEP